MKKFSFPVLFIGCTLFLFISFVQIAHTKTHEAMETKVLEIFYFEAPEDDMDITQPVIFKCKDILHLEGVNEYLQNLKRMGYAFIRGNCFPQEQDGSRYGDSF